MESRPANNPPNSETISTAERKSRTAASAEHAEQFPRQRRGNHAYDAQQDRGRKAQINPLREKPDATFCSRETLPPRSLPQNITPAKRHAWRLRAECDARVHLTRRPGSGHARNPIVHPVRGTRGHTRHAFAMWQRA
jgi:hypothetical protein